MLVGKETERRCLSADLILGIVQIGKELDFRDGDKAIMPHAYGKAEDGLFVQQCIKNPRRAEFFLQPLRYAINAALARDVLAKQRDIGIAQHQISQRKIDRFGQRHRLGKVAHVLGEQRIPVCRSGKSRRWLRGGFRLDRRHHLFPGGQFGFGQCLKRDTFHLLPHRLIAIDNFLPAQSAMLNQGTGAVQQRVLRFIGLNRFQCGIACFHVSAGMTHQAHRAHMKKDRLPPAAGVADRLFTAAHRIKHVDAVALNIFQCRAVRKIRFDPATGCAD